MHRERPWECAIVTHADLQLEVAASFAHEHAIAVHGKAGDKNFTWRDPRVTKVLAELITTTSTSHKYVRGQPIGGSSSLTGRREVGEHGHRDC